MNAPALLQRFGLRPDNRLGQNFLIDENALRKIVEIAAISPEESVLEVGPGLGGLTRLLATEAQKVIAVELDERLIPILEQVLSAYPNVQIVQGDILALDPAQLIDTPHYQVVANIPYYITSALVRHLLEAGKRPSCLVLTVQREVAGRICASPGKMSLLALSVQVYGRPQICAHIPPGAFYPTPKVDSAVIRVDIYPQPAIPYPLLGSLFRLAKAGFSQKRKTLGTSLSAGLAWPKTRAETMLLAAEIDPRRRAETLSLAEWESLTRQFVIEKVV
jgi:16S rRNA (adenine1518-N6/adenine1519-N6)-dimethyltransferase